MTEERKAYWVEAGLRPYQHVYKTYMKLYELRKKDEIEDVIISTEHPHEVNFGAAEKHNQFSEDFKKEVKQRFGNYSEDNAINLLEEKGYQFSRTSRGGGATVVAPGQYTFYPVVDYRPILDNFLDKESDKYNVTDFKRVADQIMFNVIGQFNVPNLIIANGFHETSEEESREKRDVWTKKNGIDHKIGSKGFVIGKHHAAGGMVLYAHKEGIKPFELVNACGYKPNEVGVTSIEEMTNKRPKDDEIKLLTKKEIKEIFSYDELVDISYEELLEMLD